MLLSSFSAKSQTDPFFSHYMFNPGTYNPGWLGDASIAFASFQHRSQWAGYNTTFDGNSGAPSSQLASFVVPIQGTINSAGANIVLDRQGVESTFQLEIGASYNYNLSKGVLSFGLMPSIINRRLDGSRYRTEVPDPVIQALNESQSSVDLAAGIFYRSFTGYFAGASVRHILSPELISVEGQQVESRLKPIYYFHGGNAFSVNRDLDITPTILVKSDLTGFSADISGIATYRDLMWGGISYRKSEALILLVGYNFLENKELKVGYSFDYVVKDQEAKRPTSHEIFIRYDLPSLILGGRKAVKTPRFSF